MSPNPARDHYFAGKVCVVTGAASGIGFALSSALVDQALFRPARPR